MGKNSRNIKLFKSDPAEPIYIDPSLVNMFIVDYTSDDEDFR